MNKPTKVAIISIAIALVIVSVYLILPHRNANKSNNPVNNNDGKTYLVYSLLNSATNKIEFIKYDAENNEKKAFYQLTQNNINALPLYYKYQKDKILINDGEGNDGIVVDLDGNVIENAFNPKDDLFLFSPSNKYVAYNKFSNGDNGEYHFTIREIATGVEKTVPSINAWENMPAKLYPLSWSDEEKYVYADLQAPTEGYPVGLLTINRETAEVNRNPVVDREELIQTKLDGQLNAYSLPGKGFDPFGNFASEIIELPYGTDATTAYKLTNSEVSQLYIVNSSGRYIAYAYSEKSDLNNLWIYDKTAGGKEIKITDNSVIPDSPYWNGDLLAYFENKPGSNDNGGSNAIRIYDASNGDTLTVVESSQPYSPKFQLIGWFNM